MGCRKKSGIQQYLAVGLIAMAGLSVAVIVPTRVPAGASASRTPLRLVALGDSYSAGVGVGAAVPGLCDRDGLAWAPRAYNEKTLIAGNYTKGSFDHPACSGATIPTVVKDQLGSVRPEHNVVTISVGGNDIGFADKIYGCLLGNCGPDVFEVSADRRGGAQTWETLQRDLVGLYTQVRQRMSKTGFLYVMGYPIPFARQTRRCWEFDAREQLAANAMVTRLDDTIAAAVGEVNGTGLGDRPGNVVFVDWRPGRRTKAGYVVPSGYANSGAMFDVVDDPQFGLCNREDNDPNIQGVFAAKSQTIGAIKAALLAIAPIGGGVFIGNSFHPGTPGYWRAARLFHEALRANQPLIVDDTALACGTGCSVTGRIDFDHPSWGPVVAVTTTSTRACSPGAGLRATFTRGDLVVLDATGVLRGRREMCGVDLFSPALATADAAGNIFVQFVNGANNFGVVVLVPTVAGLDDLPVSSKQRFEYRSATVPTPTVAIVASELRDTGGGRVDAQQVSTLFLWKGRDFVPVVRPSGSEVCPGELIDSALPVGGVRMTRLLAQGESCVAASKLVKAVLNANRPSAQSDSTAFGQFACVGDFLKSGSTWDYLCSDGRRTVAWSIAAVDPTAIRIDRVGTLRLGDSSQQVETVIGRRPRPGAACGGLAIRDAAPGLDLEFGTGGALDYFETTNPEHQSSTGARVGMAVEDLLITVPAATRGVTVYGDPVYRVRSDRGTIEFAVTSDGRRVAEIRGAVGNGPVLSSCD